MTHKTAILVFANSAEKELILKSAPSVDVFEILNAETLKTVKKTGLPYFHYSEKEQTGTSFGERFSNAIEAVYNKGFDTVISIGNDIPHLKVSHIHKAAKALKVSDYVLGPSTDGGFYLMGFKKRHFNKIEFEALPWENSKLRRHLNKELKQQSFGVSYLETLSDIDDISDIDRVLKSFKKLSSKIRKILIQISRIRIEISARISIFIGFLLLKLHHNKGSPLLLHI